MSKYGTPNETCSTGKDQVNHFDMVLKGVVAVKETNQGHTIKRNAMEEKIWKPFTLPDQAATAFILTEPHLSWCGG